MSNREIRGRPFLHVRDLLKNFSQLPLKLVKNMLTHPWPEVATTPKTQFLPMCDPDPCPCVTQILAHVWPRPLSMYGPDPCPCMPPTHAHDRDPEITICKRCCGAIYYTNSNLYPLIMILHFVWEICVFKKLNHIWENQSACCAYKYLTAAGTNIAHFHCCGYYFFACCGEEP